MDYFKAQFDRRTIGFTALFLTIMLLLPFVAFTHFKNLLLNYLVILKVVLIFYYTFTTLIITLVYQHAPKGYTIGQDSVIIHKRRGKIEIPFKEITGVYLESTGLYKDLGGSPGSVRGLFGYYGKGYSPKLGSFKMYATSVNKFVILKGGENYVISPYQPDKFVPLLCKRIGVPETKLGIIEKDERRHRIQLKFFDMSWKRRRGLPERVAKGIIAIGNVAIGGIAIGGLAIGGIAIGGIAIGGLAIGGIAIGGIAIGGVTIGRRL